MGFLAAGFIAVWLLVTVYVVFMTLRQRKLEKEMASLEEALRERSGARNG